MNEQSLLNEIESLEGLYEFLKNQKLQLNTEHLKKSDGTSFKAFFAGITGRLDSHYRKEDQEHDKKLTIIEKEIDECFDKLSEKREALERIRWQKN